MNNIEGFAPRFRNAAGFVVLALAASVASCADKPPACNDQAIAARLQTVFVQNVIGLVTSNLERGEKYRENKAYANELQTWLRQYAADVKLTMRSVTSEGYDSGARRQICAADFVLSTPIEEPKQNRARFALQAVADSNEPRLTIEGYQAFVGRAAMDFDFYTERRRAGVPIRR